MRTFCHSILVASLIMGFLTSCGSESETGTGSAALKLQWMTNQQALGLRGDLSGLVTTIHVTVTAEGMKSIQASANYEDYGLTIEHIPAGTGRSFVVEATDASSVLVYSGTADNITIEAGKTVTVGPVLMAPAYSQDTYPPAAITDLRATSTVGINDLDLYWTATGNDAHVGKAASYDLRISNNAIDDSNFNAATAVTGLPAPADAGSAEHVTVTGLTWGATYHFAIKAIDGSNNVSGISNDAYAQVGANTPTHTLTYSGNGQDSGSVPAVPTSYYEGQTVTVLSNTGNPVLVKAGYTFVGWNTAANGSGTPYAASAQFAMGTADVTLYAQWTNLPTHTVTYNGNTADSGNPPTGTASYYEGQTVTVFGNTGPFVKAGYTFGGWNTAANGSGNAYAASDTFTMGTANVTLYAQWMANPSHTVSYNGNTADSGNPPAGTTSYFEGLTVTVLDNTGTPPYVKAGYTFTGWNTAANGSGTGYVASQTFIMPTANVTLYAQWTANPSHTVSYNGNTADSGSPPAGPTSYLEGQTVTVLGNTGNYVKAGFTFVGWNTAANGSGTGYVASQTFIMATANVTLYAQWTALPTHTLTYNGNTADSGNPPTGPTSYYEGQTVTVLGNTGYLGKPPCDIGSRHIARSNSPLSIWRHTVLSSPTKWLISPAMIFSKRSRNCSLGLVSIGFSSQIMSVPHKRIISGNLGTQPWFGETWPTTWAAIKRRGKLRAQVRHGGCNLLRRFLRMVGDAADDGRADDDAVGHLGHGGHVLRPRDAEAHAHRHLGRLLDAPHVAGQLPRAAASARR